MSLRQRLRSDLAPCHDRLDRFFSDIDLATPPGLLLFLRAHRAAFATIRPAPGGRTGQPLLDTMIAAIDADLRHLGTAPPPRLTSLTLTHADAQDYVLLGSRLGSQVLRRRWQAATDPRVQGAGAYLSLPPLTDRWRAFCDAAGASPADGTQADATLTQSRQLFELFLAAGHAACRDAAPLVSERTA
ncbi:hypothetical protein MBELCI_0308 [Limimaricola cinnabarinus LL-001]|uniref:Heme oxygenase n=2 Tax=Limimaricola cinnabarinus TaxID=1125964 RepID=U2YHZ6_9RHOB|nr:hypothetical protein MBELCI_0308 [Limimaricola cinnabarinus LL-001]